MKVKLHLPVEEYGFIEAELHVESDEEAIEAYNALKRLKIAPTEGLSPKDWNRALDEYLGQNKMSVELYEGMSERQRLLINEIKKSFKRLAPEKELRVRPELE